MPYPEQKQQLALSAARTTRVTKQDEVIFCVLCVQQLWAVTFCAAGGPLTFSHAATAHKVWATREVLVQPLSVALNQVT
jgi:hypothetical protein